MSENIKAAACTEQEWQMAREAGLPIFTTSDEVAIRKFANAVRSEEPAALQAFRHAINTKLEHAYFLAGRYELTDKAEFKEEAERLFAEVKACLLELRNFVFSTRSAA